MIDDPPETTTGEQLLLDVAADELARPARIAVLDDGTGALTVGVLDRFGDASVSVHCDLLSAEQRVRSAVIGWTGGDVRADVEVCPELGSALDDRTDLVLINLPKSLAALDELAQRVAAVAGPWVRLLGLGRVKHMNRSMNEVLSRSFGAVRASRGRGKYRVLIAAEPLAEPLTEPLTGPAQGSASSVERFPRRARDADLDLIVCAHGAAFAGPKIDRGTRLLLGCREDWPAAGAVVDLGCGTGVLAVVAARLNPGATVIGTDDSAAACASARASAEANGLAEQISIERADGLGARPAASADLILCNPPFHVGTAKDSAPALAMLADARRVLRPDGELWTVFNTHLPYRQALRAAVGSTQIVRQDDSYMVTRTRLRPGGH